ncbi:MAG TPA: NAD-dependent epimerase/dehydratase family protein, partial [Candidatus Methylomirabilis sp.]|nr:NAD-dependent epimerase/dehydratase family protein [Candidatus Methylomirabilis sp.]
AAGHEVGVVDDLSTGVRENLNPRVQFWQVDIRSPEIDRVLAEFRPEIINHHAAQMSVSVSVRDPRLDADINILGTLNLLEGAVRHKARRVIFASTGGAMYGDQEGLPTAETVFPNPVSPYGVAKHAVERYLHAYQAMHALPAIVLRYSNVYGPRQNPHGEAGVVAIFAQGILQGRELLVNGDGEQTRDYVFVGDVVKANLLATEVPLGEEITILNIGTGIEASVNDLVAMFRRIAGEGFSWRHGPPRPGEQRRSALDSTLAKGFLRWEPTVPLQAGLAETFKWFKARA